MSRWILVQALGTEPGHPVPESGDAVTWKVCGAAAGTSVQTGSLSELGEAARGAAVALLAPAEATLTARVFVPSRQKPKVELALPYLLEDQVAADIETLHFAAGSPDGDGRITVAAVDRNLMSAWCEWAEAQGLGHARLVPENLLSGGCASAWEVVWRPDRARIATDREVFAFTPEDGVTAVRGELEARNAEALPQSLTVVPVAPAEGAPASLAAAAAEYGITLEQAPPVPHWLDALAPHFEPAAAIDLRQGPFARVQDAPGLKRRVAVAAALGAIWFGLECTSLAVENHRMGQAWRQAEEEIQATFQEALPGQEMVNPRHQMEQALASARGNEGDDTFLALLSAAAKHLAAHEIAVDSLRYRDGRLELSLRADSLQGVESMRTGFGDGLTTTLRSADSGEDGVQAQLQIQQETPR